jgi:hypothetical protein
VCRDPLRRAPENAIRAGDLAKTVKRIRRQRLTAVVAIAAVALAAPASGASAAIGPLLGDGLPLTGVPLGADVVGGTQVGSAGCIGTVRPSVGGNAGSTSVQDCGTLLAFNGPQIGQIASVVGPTIIGSPLAQVTVSAGPVTGVVP